MNSKFQDLIILTSPPASGKTFWISRFKEALGQGSLLVVSPLRALADECRSHWGREIDVMTPEEWLGKKKFYEIVIFDEFHLFFYWGDSFRPLMWEMFFEVSQRSSFTILLTATLSSTMRHEVGLFNSQFDQIYWFDHGNQKLKHLPYSYTKAPSKRWVLQQIESMRFGQEVKLIFCQYREEVKDLARHLTQKGYQCITCVGGEAKYMQEKLGKTPAPDYIISTTVLSHGVNLPDIKKIYFLYKVQNLDFWIQMVARGGRRGQRFEVIALEKPLGLQWCIWRNLLRVIVLSLRQKISSWSFPFLS